MDFNRSDMTCIDYYAFFANKTGEKNHNSKSAGGVE